MPGNSFRCSSCGQEHPEWPLSFAADYPDPYADLSVEAREMRTMIGSDQCIIDEQEFYIRGCLEIPIVGMEGVFLWGVWARMHEGDFDELADNWEVEGREKIIGPYKGRLANAMRIYPDALNQRLEIRVSPVGVRPLFVLQEAGSLLYEEQRSGLTPQKAAEYACLLMRLAGTSATIAKSTRP